MKTTEQKLNELAIYLNDCIDKLNIIRAELNISNLQGFIDNLDKMEITKDTLRNNSFDCCVTVKYGVKTYNLMFWVYYTLDYSNGSDDPQIETIETTDAEIYQQNAETKQLLLTDTDFENALADYILSNLDKF